MEIYDKQDSGFIEVWMTKAEQQTLDRRELTRQLLSQARSKKVKVIYFLSGDDDLLTCTEYLLKRNMGCA